MSGLATLPSSSRTFRGGEAAVAHRVDLEKRERSPRRQPTRQPTHEPGLLIWGPVSFDGRPIVAAPVSNSKPPIASHRLPAGTLWAIRLPRPRTTPGEAISTAQAEVDEDSVPMPGRPGASAS